MKKSVIQIILMFLASITLWSCASETDAYAKFVSEWQGKKIILPDNMTDVLTGDPIDTENADFTILTFVDSLGCTGCKMKLSLWNEFIPSIDTLDADVRIILIIQPKDLTEIIALLKREAYNYPVYLDTLSTICLTNTLPQENIYRTFLLNGDNEVIGIGNPAISSGIADFYKSIISGRSVVNNSGDGMIVVDGNIDMGVLKANGSWERNITISNTGNDTVRVHKIIPSCDCTNVALQQNYIPPKSSILAKLKLDGDSMIGKFERSIHIYYENIDYPSIIQIYGEFE